MYQIGCGDTKGGELLAYTWLIEENEIDIIPHHLHAAVSQWLQSKNFFLQNLRLFWLFYFFVELTSKKKSLWSEPTQ